MGGWGGVWVYGLSHAHSYIMEPKNTLAYFYGTKKGQLEYYVSGVLGSD